MIEISRKLPAALTFTFIIFHFRFYIPRTAPMGQLKTSRSCYAIKVSPLWGGIQVPKTSCAPFYIHYFTFYISPAASLGLRVWSLEFGVWSSSVVAP